MKPRAFAVAAAVLTVAAAVPSAEARPREGTVAILALEIRGDGEPLLRQQLQRSLAGGLAAGGLRVVDLTAAMATLKDTPELVGCTSTTCLQRIGARLGANYFVRAQVEANGSAYEIALDLLSAEVEGGQIMRVAESCPVCTIMEVNDLMSSSAKRLVELPPAQPVPVVIQSEPSGARLFVDEIDMGPAPYEGALAPGEHRLAATQPGHERAETTVIVSDDASVEPQIFSLVLTTLAAGTPGTDGYDAGAGGSRYRIWKWAAAGAGATALITGITLVAIDGGDTCDLSQPRAQCPEIYDTAAAGVASLLAGVALGGASGWMFYRDAEQARATSVTVSPTRGGGMARLTLAF